MSIPELLRFLPFLRSNNLPEPIQQRSRRELLKVMETEVNLRLDDSLCYPELIERREAQPTNVEQLAPMRVQPQPVPLKPRLQLERSLEIFGGSKTQLSPKEKIIDVFERDDIAGRLLILGAPGSGKTTTLLELAKDLIQRAQHNGEHPIPVWFELSEWRGNQRTFANWLASDLKFRHNIPRGRTRKWIKTGQLLPLLDGLDELGLTQQKLCIQKINEFLEASFGQSSLVVCCCQQEYIKGKTILETLGGVVCLQSLSDEQIEDYLKPRGFWHLWQPLKDDREGLLELAKVPWLLQLIPIVYPEGLRGLGRYFSDPIKRQEYQTACCHELLDGYIKRRLEQFYKRKSYNPKNTKHWLIWLAKTLREQNKTEFLIENLQPSLLETFKQKRLYQLICGLIGCLTAGLIGELIGGSEMELIFGGVGGIVYAFKARIEVSESRIFYCNTENLPTLGAALALMIGLILWMILGLTVWLFRYLIFWLVFGLLSGICIGLIVAMDGGDEIKSRNQPNQGIRESAQNMVVMSLISLPAGMLLYGLLRVVVGQTVEPLRALDSGLGLALFFGISYSGLACIQHFVLRLILWWSGSIPWNYAHFLAYAVKCRFIKQVGGRYRFIHTMLRDRFAQMPDS